jgi:hypothetical protein
MAFILFNLIVSNALQFTAVVHILLIATICGAVLHCYALQCHVALCVFQLNRFISANVLQKWPNVTESAKKQQKW